MRAYPSVAIWLGLAKLTWCFIISASDGDGILMPAFSGNPAVLKQRTAYEASALTPALRLLFDTSSYISSSIKIDVSQKMEDGVTYIYQEGQIGYTAISDQDVRSALNNLRPLLFANTFKIHDMIAEWILFENGNTEFSFKKKIKYLKDHCNDPTWSDPALISAGTRTGKCFWQIYEKLSDARNTINHASDFQLFANGTLKITGRKGIYTLDTISQSAYVEFMTVVCDALTNQRKSDFPLEDIVSYDLSQLAGFHREGNVSHPRVVYKDLEITVPSAHLKSLDPCVADLDLTAMKLQINKDPRQTTRFRTKITMLTGTRVVKTSLPAFSDLPDFLSIDETDSSLAFIVTASGT